MRVISGKYKNKQLIGFDINGTRPTMDRVKESLFGMIQAYLKDSVVLDLFAGSGSLGIEALSNGSSTCYFVDNNIKLIELINKNLTNVTEKSYVLKKDYIEALKYFEFNNIKFDVIFLDPPYSMNLINTCIKLIEEYDLLNSNGIIICEYEFEEFTCNYRIIKEKKYGSKNIRIYKNVV